MEKRANDALSRIPMPAITDRNWIRKAGELISDGRTYAGEFHDGQKHGQGNMKYPDGRIYSRGSRDATSGWVNVE